MNDDSPRTSAIMPAPTSAITTAEATAQAQSAREIARVQAKFALARRFPRDHMDFRVRLLKRCEDSSFASVARYSVPRGGGKPVEGPSIRFVEEAIRAFQNVDAETDVIVDDAEKRILRVGVIDLESNIGHSITITVSKTMERKQLKEGERPISSRRNSFGDIVYLLPAPEDEVTVKQNSAVSKALRTQGLRILPGEVVAEAMAQVLETKKKKVAQDPDAERKALADAFAELRVMPSQLGDYLGVDLAQATPADLVDLRGLYVAIRDGQVRFSEALEMKRPPQPDAPKVSPDVEKRQAEVKATIAKATERAAAKKGAKAGPQETTTVPDAKPTPRPEPSPGAPSDEPAEKPAAPVPGRDEPPASWEPSK